MPDPIKTQLSAAISRFTSDIDPSPHIVDANEANQLVEEAAEFNAQSAKCCGLINGTAGNQGLKEAFNPETDQYSPLAAAIVDQFANTGRALDSEFQTNIESFISETDVTPGIIDRQEASELIGTALRLNRTGGNWFKRLFKIKNTTGTKDLVRLRKNTDSILSPDAKKVLDSFIKTGEADKVISEWKSSKETWHCHWFPMKETKEGGGDTTNNLFAPGGALEKYDQVFGTKSREYELANNFRKHDSKEKDASWAGHCNNASELACMVKEPKRSVTYKDVTFSPRDIAGLLVKVSGSLRGDFDFVGNRYNREEDIAGDPKPHVFLQKVLREWGTDAEESIPFVLDIDRKTQVWNYPYDQGRITESLEAPEDFDFSVLEAEGNTLFYRAEIKGTTFDAQARNYEFFIQYAEDGSVLKSDWIKGADSKISPDFAWRPHATGDLSKKENWVTNTFRQNNPHVRAEDVFEIYSRSV